MVVQSRMSACVSVVHNFSSSVPVEAPWVHVREVEMNVMICGCLDICWVGREWLLICCC